jgi:pseudouridine synthase
VIASSGYCSRRKAEELIRAGRVTLNGYVAKLGERADETDEITVNKQKLSQESEKIYLMLNKPVGYTCTNRRFEGEKNIFALIKTKARLFAVGRLDKDSRGLVLLTNDGDLAAKLTHPKFTSEKVYEVKVKDDERLLKKASIDSVLRALRRGVDLGEGEGLGFAKVAEYDYGTFTLVLTTGRKRQVRRMFQGLRMHVTDLKRVMQSGLRLGNLAEGQYRELTEGEVKKLSK